MTTFGELPQVVAGTIGCIFFLLFLSFTFLLLLGFTRKWRYNLLKGMGLFFGMVVTYVLLQCILAAHDGGITSPTVIKMAKCLCARTGKKL